MPHDYHWPMACEFADTVNCEVVTVWYIHAPGVDICEKSMSEMGKMYSDRAGIRQEEGNPNNSTVPNGKK